MHQVVRSQLAARRAGTHSTLTRGKVSGGGKKPWRQKGTGRARQGSTRSPQWAGGGVVFGPHPRSYAFKVPNKVVKLAMRSALSAKLADEVLYVVDGFGFEKPSTKQAAEMLKALGITGRVTVVVAERRHQRHPVAPQPRQGARHHRLRGQHLRSRRQHRRAVHEAGPDLARGGAVLMNDPRDIIIRPVISEKSYDMIEHEPLHVRGRQDREQAADRARRSPRSSASRSPSVNTMNVTGKPRRVRAAKGKTRDWKKAIVTLKEGDSIEFFQAH